MLPFAYIHTSFGLHNNQCSNCKGKGSGRTNKSGTRSDGGVARLRVSAAASGRLRVASITARRLGITPVTTSWLRVASIATGGLRVLVVAASWLRIFAVASSGLGFASITAGWLRVLTVASSGLRFNPVTAGWLRVLTISTSGLRFSPVTAGWLRVLAITASRLRVSTVASCGLGLPRNGHECSFLWRWRRRRVLAASRLGRHKSLCLCFLNGANSGIHGDDLGGSVTDRAVGHGGRAFGNRVGLGGIHGASGHNRSPSSCRLRGLSSLRNRAYCGVHGDDFRSSVANGAVGHGGRAFGNGVSPGSVNGAGGHGE